MISLSASDSANQNQNIKVVAMTGHPNILVMANPTKPNFFSGEDLTKSLINKTE